MMMTRENPPFTKWITNLMSTQAKRVKSLKENKAYTLGNEKDGSKRERESRERAEKDLHRDQSLNT